MNEEVATTAVERGTEVCDKGTGENGLAGVASVKFRWEERRDIGLKFQTPDYFVVFSNHLVKPSILIEAPSCERDEMKTAPTSWEPSVFSRDGD